MRGAQVQEKDAACRAALGAVLEAARLPAAQQVVRDDQGWVNLCYLVTLASGDEVVIRFNARDPHIKKFCREREAYALARRAGLPAPELLWFDTSRQVAPYDVMVARRLPGENLQASWPTLSPSAREALAYQAGEALATLHTISLLRWGATHDEEPRFARWDLCARAMLDGFLDEARACEAMTEAQASQAEALLDAASPTLAQLTRPVLVHGDFHLGNVLHHEGQISAVLDFEWSLAGPPALDLMTLSRIEPHVPGALAPLRAGYANRAADLGLPSLPAEVEALVVTTGRLLRRVELCAVTRQHFPDEHDASLQALACALDALAQAVQTGEGV